MYYKVRGTHLRLLGSIHPVLADRAAMPPFVERAYSDCERVAFEMDVTSVDLRWHVSLPEGETLDQRVPMELLQRIRALWPATHPFGMLQSQSLWLIALRIPLLLAAIAPGLAPGVEKRLSDHAAADGKPIHFLETPAEFAQEAAGIEDARYVDLFGAMLERLPESVTRFMSLRDAWMAGDSLKLEEELAYSQSILPPAVKRALFDQRNVTWLPRILELAAAPGVTLVVVGAAHLSGDGSLVDLLEQQGHEVSPAV